MSRVKNEEDVMLYYHRFLQMSTSLYKSKKLTDYQGNAEGFHLKNRDILAYRLEVLKLDQ